jgi:hypothetical protein
MPDVTAPSVLRDVVEADLLALLPGGPPAHIGTPEGCRFTLVGDTNDSGVIPLPGVLVTPAVVQDEGDRWFMRIGQVLDALTRDGTSDDLQTLQNLLGKTLSAAAQTALRYLGFIPVVYQAGPTIRRATVAKPAHCKLTYSGVFGSPSAPLEIWSWGMTFLDIPNHGGTTQALADKAAGLWGTYLKSFTSPVITLTKTRVAFLGDGAHVNKNADGVFDQADNLDPQTGTGDNSPIFPLQTALVASFYSLRQDATGRGRAFVPLQGVPLDSSFIIPVQTATNLATAMKLIAAGMEDAAGPHVGQHAVISSLGHTSVVTQYKCGRVPDTMRSRRNALKEQYSVLPAS